MDLLGQLHVPLILEPFSARIRCFPFSDYSTYLQRIGQADVGLIPLEPGLHTDAKSAIRWMEFSYLGLASILSPTSTYTEILNNGVHALFATGTDEWVKGVEQLLADPAGTRAMALRAQKHAADLFGPHQAEEFWRPLIQSDALLVSPCRKLLMLNVYFAPQSVGGATRVVQDQVRALCDDLGDQWDVTVLCTDADQWMVDVNDKDQPSADSINLWEIERVLPLHVHAWHGARVVRLSVPSKSWAHHHDVSVENLCRRWFSKEHFDLIHCHCVQELGIGPLQVAAELGLPYVVTLHDGWWLSQRQFLTTPGSSGGCVGV